MGCPEPVLAKRSFITEKRTQKLDQFPTLMMYRWSAEKKNVAPDFPPSKWAFLCPHRERA
jgi:hypothetical protein